MAVATGPGGFTSTRMSLVLARTLAQQIGCPIDGICSFTLMAPRLVQKLDVEDREKAFWITQDLPRKGKIGGKYQIIRNSSNILNALNTAKAKGLKSYAILGYDGGKCLSVTDVPIHFRVDDMQVAEDVQLIVGHICMQWLTEVKPR